MLVFAEVPLVAVTLLAFLVTLGLLAKFAWKPMLRALRPKGERLPDDATDTDPPIGRFESWQAFWNWGYAAAFLSCFFTLPIEIALNPEGADPNLAGPFMASIFLTSAFSMVMWLTNVYDAAVRRGPAAQHLERIAVAALSPLTGGFSGLLYYLLWGRKPLEADAASTPELKLQRAQSAERCPYCHSDFVDHGVVCASCLARHHLDCWDDHQACSGCGGTDRYTALERTAGRKRPETGTALPQKSG